MPEGQWRVALLNFINDHLEAILAALAFIVSLISGIYVYINKTASRFFRWIFQMIALPTVVNAIHQELQDVEGGSLKEHLASIQLRLELLNNRLAAEASKSRAMADFIFKEAIAEMDATGAIIWYNQAMASQMGRHRPLYGHSWQNLIHNEDRADLDRLLRNGITTRSAIDITARYNYNPSMNIRIDARPIVTPENALLGFITFFSLHPSAYPPTSELRTSPNSSNINEL